jgi:hypothetical protein
VSVSNAKTQEGQMRKHFRIRRLVVAFAVVAAASLVQAGPAAAAGHGATTGGTGTATVTCDTSDQSVHAVVLMSKNLYQGFRLHGYDHLTGEWSSSDWQMIDGAGYTTLETHPAGVFQFLVEYAWWDGSDFEYASDAPDSMIQNHVGPVANSGYATAICRTV